MKPGNWLRTVPAITQGISTKSPRRISPGLATGGPSHQSKAEAHGPLCREWRLDDNGGRLLEGMCHATPQEYGAGEGSRTLTDPKAERILSPPRLPLSPPRRAVDSADDTRSYRTVVILDPTSFLAPGATLGATSAQPHDLPHRLPTVAVALVEYR